MQAPRHILEAVATAGIAVCLLRFGAFELDLKNSELRRGGVLVKISPQQFRVLRWLAEHTGQICSREDIQREIWGSEVFVDFDRSLTVSIAQIRAALNDDAEAPRFIQTVPRRGYRFVAPVEQISEVAAVEPTPPPPPVPTNRWVPALCCAAVIIAGGALAVWYGAAPARRTLIAVLPFENITQRAEDTPIIEGLEDELIGQFGSLQPERLGVIGRTSVRHYKDRHPGLPQIGRELGVDYVIEGDVRRDGARIRISTRLIQVAGQAQTWAETYEREDSHKFELQEEIAARVSAAVARSLFPAVASPSARGHKPDREAYEAFANGRYLQHKNSRTDSERSLGWFEEAGKRDPSYAEPWAAMAHVYVGLALSGSASPADQFEKGRAAAQKALHLDERNAEAHNALAEVCFWRDWNWKEAELHFQRALAINPSFAQAHHDYASYLVATGHAEAAVAALRRAVALDPLSPRVNVDAGWVLLQAHHFAEAIAQAKRALELEPGLAQATACIALAERDERAYRSILDRGERASHFHRAMAYAGLGRKDEALAALQSSYEQRDVMMPLINTEPAFAGLHRDPRFRAIVGKMGLP